MQRAKHFELPLMRAQWLHNTQPASGIARGLGTVDLPHTMGGQSALGEGGGSPTRQVA
jgi:hypothetical protein